MAEKIETEGKGSQSTDAHRELLPAVAGIGQPARRTGEGAQCAGEDETETKPQGRKREEERGDRAGGVELESEASVFKARRAPRETVVCGVEKREEAGTRKRNGLSGQLSQSTPVGTSRVRRGAPRGGYWGHPPLAAGVVVHKEIKSTG